MSFLNKNTLNCLCGQWKDGKNLLKTLILAFGVISKVVQPVLNQFVLFFHY